MKRKTCVVDKQLWPREDVQEAALAACTVIDDPEQPEMMRLRARKKFEEWNEILCHQTPDADGERSCRLVPVGMRWRNFYTDMVEELLLDLGDEVTQQNPAYVVMGRLAARLVDNRSYATDFRLDALDALHQLIGSLKGAQV
jgi:hypothetical protein